MTMANDGHERRTCSLNLDQRFQQEAARSAGDEANTTTHDFYVPKRGDKLVRFACTGLYACQRHLDSRAQVQFQLETKSNLQVRERTLASGANEGEF